jgi:hypothetical protein
MEPVSKSTHARNSSPSAEESQCPAPSAIPETAADTPTTSAPANIPTGQSCPSRATATADDTRPDPLSSSNPLPPAIAEPVHEEPGLASQTPTNVDAQDGIRIPERLRLPVDANAIRRLLLEAQILWNACSSCEGEGVEVRAINLVGYVAKLQNLDDRDLEWVALPQGLASFARDCHGLLLQIEDSGRSFDASRLVRCFGEVLIYTAEVPGRRKPEVPLPPVSIEHAIFFLLALLAWGKDGESPGSAERADETPATKVELALGVLIAHPEWTNKRIAKEVGCHPKSLSRSVRFTEARAAIKSGKQRLPRGTKDATTGSLEAWKE